MRKTGPRKFSKETMQAISLELRDRSDHIETVRYVPSLVDEKRPIQVVEGSGVLQEAPSRCTFPK